MKLWSGEDWFLQIDSHHRFAQDWDTLLIAEAEATGAANPLLMAGAAPYEPPAPPSPGHPTRIIFDHFDEDGILHQGAAYLDETQKSRPMRARFLSAHFLFAPGRFVSEVPMIWSSISTARRSRSPCAPSPTDTTSSTRPVMFCGTSTRAPRA